MHFSAVKLSVPYTFHTMNQSPMSQQWGKETLYILFMLTQSVSAACSPAWSHLTGVKSSLSKVKNAMRSTKLTEQTGRDFTEIRGGGTVWEWTFPHPASLMYDNRESQEADVSLASKSWTEIEIDYFLLQSWTVAHYKCFAVNANVVFE